MRICMKNTLLCIENGRLCLNVCQRYYGHFCPGGTKGIQAFPFFVCFFLFIIISFFFNSQLSSRTRENRSMKCVCVCMCVNKQLYGTR